MAVLNAAAEFFLIVALEENDFAAVNGAIAVRRETTKAMMRIRIGGNVIHVNIMILVEMWIECHTEQTAFPTTIHLDGDERQWQQKVVFDDAQRSGLLANEQPTIGCEVHRRRAIDAGDDGRLGEPFRQFRRPHPARRGQRQHYHQPRRAPSHRHATLPPLRNTALLVCSIPSIQVRNEFLDILLHVVPDGGIAI